MLFRMFSVAALTLSMLVGATALAAKDGEPKNHDGKVVSIIGDSLVMKSENGQEHSHKLAANARLTLDGKVCKAADLKAGTTIRVTTQGSDNNVATRVEGLDRNREFAAQWHDGKVISITAEKLVMTGKDGKEHSHELTANAKLTLDGEVCKATDLKAGTRIRVTTKSADGSVVTRVEGIERNRDFAANRHDGKVVSMIGSELVMTGMQDKKQHTCTLTDDTKITCDGEVCKSSDLKPGMRIRVTTNGDDPPTVTRIEAIDVNPEFASR